jgi:hypothetical protein
MKYRIQIGYAQTPKSKKLCNNKYVLVYAARFMVVCHAVLGNYYSDSWKFGVQAMVKGR